MIVVHFEGRDWKFPMKLYKADVVGGGVLVELVNKSGDPPDGLPIRLLLTGEHTYTLWWPEEED